MDRKYTEQERADMVAAMEAYRAFLNEGQEDFATRLGVSRSTYSSLVRTKFATDATCEKMLAALDKGLEELLEWYKGNLAFVQSGKATGAQG
jgi:transcriptional regulator with XRE-family HTH domain